MIQNGGTRDELGDRLVQAKPGVLVARSLADGDVDLGFQQLGELVGQPGVRILGVLSEDCAIDTVFSGAVAVALSAPAPAAAAADVLRFFASEEAGRIKAEHSFGAPQLLYTRIFLWNPSEL